MADSNHIFGLARTQYPKSHWWQDVGEIRSLLLFENPGRVHLICKSLSRKWQDKRKEGSGPSICSNLRWKWLQMQQCWLRPDCVKYIKLCRENHERVVWCRDMCFLFVFFSAWGFWELIDENVVVYWLNLISRENKKINK